MKARWLVALTLCAASSAALPGSDDERVNGSASSSDTTTAAPRIESRRLPTLPDQIERELAVIERDERALKKELAELGGQAERVHGRTVARGRAYARLARAGLLPVTGGFDALVEHATKVERIRRALELDLRLERELAERRTRLGKRLEGLRVRRGPLEVQQQAMAEARTALLSAQDRRMSFESAFQSSSGGSHVAIYGSGIGPADSSDWAGGFRALRGRLPFPLTGRTEIHAARRVDGPGLEMRAPRGTAVRAVASGRVAFADRYSDYGQTVIVDHGDQHYTVSGNLEDLSVQVGDDVSAGTRLGSIGDFGRGPMLYFEVRIGSENVDPADWFGIDVR